MYYYQGSFESIPWTHLYFVLLLTVSHSAVVFLDSSMDDDGCCSSLRAAPGSIQVFTHNITRHPIAWDPARQRPTQELVHAIHSALHFALDPCVNHPDEMPSFCVIPRPLSSFSSLQSDGTTTSSVPEHLRLIIPCTNDIAHSRSADKNDVRDKAELTVKLFAGFDGVPLLPEHVEEALDALQRVCSSERTIDTFVISLEGVKWSGTSVHATSSDNDLEIRHIDAMKEAWKYLSNQARVQQIGVADFSQAHLARLTEVINSEERRSDAKATGLGGALSDECPSKAANVLKLPTVDQLNFDDDLPPELTSLSEHQGISLVSHSDELGTQRQFVNLLLEFKHILPLPVKLRTKPFREVNEVFKMSWVLKYTLLLTDRGLVADNGYVISAELPAT